MSFTGPGCSSLGVGALSENGPFRPNGKVLLRNEYSWNKGFYFIFFFLLVFTQKGYCGWIMEFDIVMFVW